MKSNLVSLIEFVEGIKDYAHESQNHARALRLIFAYQEFLNTPVCREMFTGRGELLPENNDKPLFEDFQEITQMQGIKKNILKSFTVEANGDFMVTVFRKYMENEKPSFITKLGVKTINDLVGHIDIYHTDGTQWGWTEENDIDNSSLQPKNEEEQDKPLQQPLISDSLPLDRCMCLKCLPNKLPNIRFNVCGICGNKRCPHATDHNYKCTNSNDFGQEGSVYVGNYR